MDVRHKMNREEVAKLIESIPQGLDQDDFLVALANKAAEVEREACALTAEGFAENRDWVSNSLWGNLRSEVANKIRARSK